MSGAQEPPMVREAVGVFDTADNLQDAIDDLMMSGFERAELSLLASERAVEEKLGHKYQKTTELTDNAAVPRSIFVSREELGNAEGGLIGILTYVGAMAAAGAIVASGGTIAVVIAGAVAAGGVGAAIGTVLARHLDKQHAHNLKEQLDRGGLLLWVHTRDAADEQRATAILKFHHARDVHVHTLPSAPSAA